MSITRTFASLADGDHFDFNVGDKITFGASLKASKLVLKEVGGNLLLTYGAKTVTLETFSLADITATSFVFADGSLVKAGTAGADTVAGADFDDLLYGLDGADQVSGKAGADFLYGGAGKDKLNGSDGNDTLDGGTGADTLTGGLGSDSFVIDSLGDVVTELADSLAGVDDVDTVTDLVNDDTLDANVENMVLGNGIVKGTGNSIDNKMTGNNAGNELFGMGGADTLLGKGGNDLLDGGGGADSMNGAGGDDTYVLDRASDGVSDSAGIDTVKIGVIAGFNYALQEGVIENLDASMVLTNGRTYTGNTSANVMTDGAAASTLDGGDGNDSLSGGGGNDSLLGGYGDDTLDGGDGKDTLSGGTGNDMYVVDRATDQITDDGGTDTVVITGSTIASYSVYGGALENIFAGGSSHVGGLELHGSADAGNEITGTGSAGDLLIGYGGNDTLNGGAGNDTMIGGTGNDIYYVDGGNGESVQEQTGQGADWVVITGNTNGTYVLPDWIEYLNGGAYGGSVHLTGNAIDNGIIGSGHDDVLDGGAGNDTLTGGAGADELTGGSGNDHYYIESAGDTIIEVDGDDTVHLGGSSLGSYTLAEILEHLDASGSAYGNLYLGGNTQDNSITGSNGDDTIVGYGGEDSLSGGAGNDSITGGNVEDSLNGGAGNDTMVGGLGDDTFTADSVNDVVLDSGGVDTILLTGGTIVTMYGMQAWIEQLDASGTSNFDGASLLGNDSNNTITGSNYDDTIQGGAGEDVIHGGDGDDYLFGALEGNPSSHIDDTLDGGAGADTLAGSYGSDTYVIDNAGDSIEGEQALWDSDTVQIVGSSLSAYSLAEHDYIENLDASGSSYADGLTLAGSAQGNHITGSDGDDTIDGGAGNDVLAGGYGDDVYYIDVAGDSITDSGGIDTVRLTGDSSVHSYDLSTAAGGAIENVNGSLSSYGGGLTLTGSGASNSIVGSNYGDSLLGGDDDDTLDGGGGTDTLDGGYGDDVYWVNVAGDSIVNEQAFAGGGVDTVRITGSSITTYDLGSLANVENLDASESTHAGEMTLTGTSGNNYIIGSGGIEFISSGNGGFDTLEGGGGNDTIDAQASYGSTLDGGSGNDMLFGSASSDVYCIDSYQDTISDLSGTDTVVLKGSSISSYSLGATMENLDGSQTDYGGGLNLNGNSGFNVITGSAGNDTLLGGEPDGGGDDTLIGGAGIDSMSGGLGDDVFLDDFTFGANFHIDAGDGTDTIRFAGGQDVDLAGTSAITGIEVLDLLTDTGSNLVDSVDEAKVLAMTGAGTLTIDGDESDAVNSDTAWHFVETTDGYDYYTSGGATLVIDSDIVFVAPPES